MNSSCIRQAYWIGVFHIAHSFSAFRDFLSPAEDDILHGSEEALHHTGHQNCTSH